MDHTSFAAIEFGCWIRFHHMQARACTVAGLVGLLTGCLETARHLAIREDQDRRHERTVLGGRIGDWQLLGRYSTLFKTAEKRLESTFPPDRTTATLRPRILSFS
jgi:hypothetical protein